MKLIALIGSVGVGKTFWGRQLVSSLGSCQFIEEKTEENLYLAEFYSDMKKWGFHSRISMLSMVLANIKKVDCNYDYVIVDRCLQELIVFARKEYEDGNMTEKEFLLYTQIYESICSVTIQPDLYVYFYCTPKTSLERVKFRGRSVESQIKLSFLEDVMNRYNKWIDSVDNSKVLKVNTESNVDLNSLTDLIKSYF